MFRRLEDNVARGSEKNLSEYLEVFPNLQEPTKTVLGYTLDIASHLDDSGLNSNYLILGGYAVLINLMDSYGVDVARTWRGSDDVDMAGNIDVLNAVRSGYNLESDLPSPNIPNKRTLKMATNAEETCKVDFYLGNYESKYGSSIDRNLFGLSVPTLVPQDIIKGKLYTPPHEMQHYGDIFAMVSVLENEGFSPGEIANFYDESQSKELKKRLVEGEREFKNDRFGFYPSNSFMKSIKKDLRGRRRVIS